eukprot:TRINITY_DN7289_c0_g1_i1.p1 TRINITY_DN7289_c0_g1~~TRINITY_DN7289_c0_g1_i1.p1  ORF type:complete len:228 (+),score=58.13 TRINITY_DN7289_c0_g1_i1:29-685(+)
MSGETKYKLYYFNGKGKAECIRYIFALANIAYDEVRFGIPTWNIPGDEGFEDMKPNLPFGQLPALDIITEDGTVQLVQSYAIERYLSRQFGLLGNSDIQAAQIESVQEAVLDVVKAYTTAKPKGDEALEAFWSETFPLWVQRLEGLMVANPVSDEWIVGESYSYADLKLFYLWEFFDAQDKVNATLAEHGPLLAANRERFGAIPSVASYIDARPETVF